MGSGPFDTQRAQAIDYFSAKHPLRKPANWFADRAREHIFELYLQKMPVGPQVRVIDVGVTPDQSMPNSNFFERLYPYKSQITATSIEDASFLEKKYPGLKFVQTGPLGLPFKDNEFDVAFCSAVIEHVGNRDQQRHFILELMRVAKSFFVTTPNRYFPFEVHTLLPFVHWLPDDWNRFILNTLKMHFWASPQNLNLLSANQFLSLFRPAPVHLYRYRLFGLTSNLVVYGSGDTMLNNQADSPKLE